MDCAGERQEKAVKIPLGRLAYISGISVAGAVGAVLLSRRHSGGGNEVEAGAEKTEALLPGKARLRKPTLFGAGRRRARARDRPAVIRKILPEKEY
ncbi:MAG: hypothetical protein ACLT8E_09270 [Akkermansia sp.]